MINFKNVTQMDNNIKRVEDRIEYRSSDKKTLELYKAREASLHERSNFVNGAREEGLKQGLEQGMKQGKIQVAQNLISLGMDINTIASASGLSVEEISKLKTFQ